PRRDPESPHEIQRREEESRDHPKHERIDLESVPVGSDIMKGGKDGGAEDRGGHAGRHGPPAQQRPGAPRARGPPSRRPPAPPPRARQPAARGTRAPRRSPRRATP